MRHESKAPSLAATGAFENETFVLTLADGFYVHPKQSHTFSQLFEPCLSCGRRLRLTRATITVRGVCGHVAVCKVCASCVIERGLIG